MWICPYCRHQVELTWKRYFTEPGLQHRCDYCGKTSRVDGALSPKIWTLRTLGVLLGGLPVGIVGYQYGLLPGLVGFGIGALATGLPIDKYIDERRRQLTAPNEETVVGDKARCVQCGGNFRIEELISVGNYRVCARCKPVFLQKLAEGAPMAPKSAGQFSKVYQYPGHGERLFARIVQGQLARGFSLRKVSHGYFLGTGISFRFEFTERPESASYKMVHFYGRRRPDSDDAFCGWTVFAALPMRVYWVPIGCFYVLRRASETTPPKSLQAIKRSL